MKRLDEFLEAIIYGFANIIFVLGLIKLFGINGYETLRSQGFKILAMLLITGYGNVFLRYLLEDK